LAPQLVGQRIGTGEPRFRRAATVAPWTPHAKPATSTSLGFSPSRDAKRGR